VVSKLSPAELLGVESNHDGDAWGIIHVEKGPTTPIPRMRVRSSLVVCYFHLFPASVLHGKIAKMKLETITVLRRCHSTTACARAEQLQWKNTLARVEREKIFLSLRETTEITYQPKEEISNCCEARRYLICLEFGWIAVWSSLLTRKLRGWP